MYCPKCGTYNKEASRFCKNCGQPLLRKARPARAPKKMSWLMGILVLATVCVVAAILVCPRLESMPFPAGMGLPRDIERIIFDESKFAELITVRLAGRDDPQALCLRSIEPFLVGRGWVHRDGLRNFLVKNGYAWIETVPSRDPLGLATECKLLFYTEAIQPYIVSGSSEPGSYFGLLLARRKLRRIDFTNQYEQLGEKYYAVKFTYTLEEELPGLPDVEKEFKGKAELYWDPSEGAWTLQYVDLDRGYYEYDDLLSEIYGE